LERSKDGSPVEQEARRVDAIAIAMMRQSPVAPRDRAFDNPLPLLVPGRDGARRRSYE
jgi:hypothetical protein